MIGRHLTNLLLLTEGEDGSELLEHLLVDRVMKMGIVVAALLVLALGLVVIANRTDRRRPHTPPPNSNDDGNRIADRDT